MKFEKEEKETVSTLRPTRGKRREKRWKKKCLMHVSPEYTCIDLKAFAAECVIYARQRSTRKYCETARKCLAVEWLTRLRVKRRTLKASVQQRYCECSPPFPRNSHACILRGFCKGIYMAFSKVACMLNRYKVSFTL